MYNNQLIKIISTFNRKEMTYFKEFVTSPYFNKHEGVIALIGYLSSVFPNFNEKNCEGRVVYKEVFGKETFSNSKLAPLFSYSMRLLERFMAQQTFEDNPSAPKVYLNEFLQEKKLYKYASKILSLTDSSLEKNEKRNADYIRKKLSLKRAYSLNDASKGNLLKSETLEEKQLFLEAAFLSEKIQDACELLVKGRILKKDPKEITENFAIKEVTTNPERYEQFPAIKVYLELFRMLSSGEEKYYKSVLLLIEEMEAFFTLNELKTIYSYIQNFCVSKINSGESGYFREVFNLYKLMVEKGVIFEKGYLSQWYYKNIIYVATRLDERKWVENFMEVYRHKLDPAIAENAYSFNLASYYYSIGEFEKVLQLLLQVEYTDPRYSLGAKVLLLQSYYDLEEYEALFSLTDSFRQFLKRNNLLADARKSGYASLFKLAKRAAKIQSRIEYSSKEVIQREVEKLKADFDKADRIFYKNWLLKKIEGLEG